MKTQLYVSQWYLMQPIMRRTSNEIVKAKYEPVSLSTHHVECVSTGKLETVCYEFHIQALFIYQRLLLSNKSRWRIVALYSPLFIS